jgi:hypothetical protein
MESIGLVEKWLETQNRAFYGVLLALFLSAIDLMPGVASGSTLCLG